MALRDYTRLKSASLIGESQITNQLEDNLLAYYNWAFLGIGAFVNVDIPTSGIGGGTFSTLRAVEDPAYTNGQIWESARKDWVWETGVEYTGTQPYQVTGVYVGGTPYGTGDATYGHYVDYQKGRIVFDTAISTSAVVTVKHSYRSVQFYKADDASWLQEIQFNSFRPDSTQFTQTASGTWAIGSQHRIQLPCVVVEAIPQGDSHKGFQMGDGSLIVTRDICFHVIAENRYTRNKITEDIALNIDKTILLYDVDLVDKNQDYPINYLGQLQSNPKMYPELIEDYLTRRCWLKQSKVSASMTYSPFFHFATVRVSCEVILPDRPG